MPTNVTPAYKDAEARYRGARTDEERLAALQEMERTLNKHKGTEKLHADIKSRIKALRTDLEKHEKHKGHSVAVEREGAGQIALVGAPNAGKSSVVASLTHATPEIGDYPFTTSQPLAGMLRFEDVGIQLVDLPPIAPHHAEGWLFGLVRNADAAFLVFDATALDPLAEVRGVLALLEEHGLCLVGDLAEARRDGRLFPKRALLVATRMEVEGAEEMAALVRAALPTLPMVGLGADGRGRDEVPRRAFELLGLVRAYSKAPGKEADHSKPFVFHQGETLADFAVRVHKDFAEKLAFARVWGPGKYDGQRVHRDYALADGDVIELHM
jgi:hypothetical protein